MRGALLSREIHSRIGFMEVAAGLEPAKTGFADQRLDRFGIATKSSETCTKPCATCTRVIPKTVPKLNPQRLFAPIKVLVNY